MKSHGRVEPEFVLHLQGYCHLANSMVIKRSDLHGLEQPGMSEYVCDRQCTSPMVGKLHDECYNLQASFETAPCRSQTAAG